MNGKIAKQIRRMRPVVAAGGWDNAEYDTKTVSNSNLDFARNLSFSVTEYKTLKPNCGRKIYQNMKRVYKNATIMKLA